MSASTDFDRKPLLTVGLALRRSTSRTDQPFLAARCANEICSTTGSVIKALACPISNLRS